MAETFGYIRNELDESEFSRQLNSLVSRGCSQIFIETDEGHELTKLLSRIGKKDEIIINNLESLGKTTKELVLILEKIEKTGAILVSIEDQLATNKPFNCTLLDMAKLFIEMDQAIIQNRQIYYQEKITKDRDIGRPKIENEKINQIIYNYDKHKMSYREISEIANVSLGTVHKYIKKYTEEQLQS